MRRIFLLVTLVFTAACAGGQYKYVRVVEPIPSGKTQNLSAEEQQVEQMLQQAAQSPVGIEYFGKMFRTAVLVMQDFDNLTFTVRTGKGSAQITRGTDKSIEPDYVIPMRRQNCENLLKFLADGKIDDEEAYRFHYLTYVAGVRSLFRVPALYDERIATELAFPRFMHMSLKNEKQYVFPNSTKEISATVVNVNGQWLVFEGLLGDPDLKMALTHQQISELATLVFAAPANESPASASGRLTAIKTLLNSVTTYRRQ
jgi:hypothetical protein